MANNYQDNHFDEVSRASLDAVDWFNHVEDEEILKTSNSHIIELCKLKNEASYAYDVLKTKTTIGIYGASQVGKSYLVSTLAAFGNNDLVANLNGKEVSFFEHLNPMGGDTEATGVVTRFTKNIGQTPANFPIRLSVFNEIDLVKILADSYFKDLNLNSKIGNSNDSGLSLHDAFFLDESKINQFFDDLLTNAKYKLKEGEQCFVDEPELVSLGEYVISIAKGVLANTDHKHDLDSLFWTRLRKTLPKINLEGRTKAYILLWNNLESYTGIFTKVAPYFSLLEGKSRVYGSLESIIDLNGEIVSRKTTGSLLDISVLAQLDKPSYDDSPLIKIALDLEAKKVIELPFCVLNFATRELAFPLPENSKADNFEILDFPGARSRKVDDISLEIQSALNRSSEHLRRGKVAYLFETYSKRHEVDILLWCLKVSGQNEVIEEQIVPVTQWVETNVGKTAAQRKKFGKVPLVGAFTRFDALISLNMDSDVANPDVSEISKRLSLAMEGFSQSWLTDWSGDGCFNQFFCVRRPNLIASQALYEVDANGVEIKLLDTDKVKKQIALYKSYVCKNNRAQHLYQYDPETNYARPLDEVLKPSDGGVNYLVEFLNNNFKDYDNNKQKIVQTLKQSVSDIEKVVSTYVNLKNEDRRKKLLAQGLRSIKYLFECNTLANTLSDIRHYLEIDEELVLKDYKENFSDGVTSGAYRFASTLSKLHFERLKNLREGKAFLQLFATLNKLYQDSLINLKSLPDEEKVKNYSFFIKDLNANEYALIENSKDLKAKFASLMEFYTLELEKAYKAKGIEQRIVTTLEQNENKMQTASSKAPLQTKRALNVISDFNTYLNCFEQSSVFDKLKCVPKIVCDKKGQLVLLDIDNQSTFYEHSLQSVSYTGAQKPVSMCLLPDINQSIVDNYGQNYYLDYFSLFLDLIVNENLNVESKYKLSSEQNIAMGKIIDRLNITFKDFNDEA